MPEPLLWIAALAVIGALGALGLKWQQRRRQREAQDTQPLAAPAGPRETSARRGDTVAAPLDTVIEPAADAPLRQLGPFRIERDVGRGAMGMVMLGHDERDGRKVAIKTMALGREFHGDTLLEARDRFFREAEMAGKLHHPDIVRILGSGELDGLAYIAMEWIDGRDLSEHAQPSRLLPVADVLEIGARVADALAYAHSQGVTHRDIKPANVMINPASGLVKVTDFGIARIIDSQQTRTGLVLGTPSFMSPEQMAGIRVDGRSDLYSLGVTLFQLLTGQLPHQTHSMAELIRAIANDPAPDVRQLRPELPQALADVLALALEKRSEVRYGQGREFADDLRTVRSQWLAAHAQAPASAPETGSPVHNLTDAR
jgi:serine/threonine protein kinase